ncbi:MAG: hypothetical protein ACKESB_00655, partial [Candidatus Hodgkinia cicadicola]
MGLSLCTFSILISAAALNQALRFLDSVRGVVCLCVFDVSRRLLSYNLIGFVAFCYFLPTTTCVLSLCWIAAQSASFRLLFKRLLLGVPDG